MSTDGYEIGADEHVGDDIGAFEIGDDIGAARSRRAAPRGMMPPAVMTPFGMGDRVAQQSLPRRMARQILPLGIAAAVAPGAAFTFTVQPQRPFRCDRLFLSTTGAAGLAGWTVEAVTVGATPQFVSTGSAPAECFARDSFGAALRGDTANPGVQVVVTVTNRGVAPADLVGAILGEALQM